MSSHKNISFNSLAKKRSLAVCEEKLKSQDFINPQAQQSLITHQGNMSSLELLSEYDTLASEYDSSIAILTNEQLISLMSFDRMQESPFNKEIKAKKGQKLQYFDLSDQFEIGGSQYEQISQTGRKNTLTADEIIDPIHLGNDHQQIPMNVEVIQSRSSSKYFKEFCNNNTSPSLQEQLNCKGKTLTCEVISGLANQDNPDPHYINYLETTEENEQFMKKKERIAIIDWMQQFCGKKNLSRETSSLAINLFDRLISIATQQMTKILKRDQKKLESYAVSCLFIACKMEEVKPPSLNHMTLCVNSSLEELAHTEQEVLRLLQWNLNIPHHYYWFNLFIAHWEKKSAEPQDSQMSLTCDEAIIPNDFYFKVMHIFDLLILDVASCKFKSHIFALSILYFASYINTEINKSVCFDCKSIDVSNLVETSSNLNQKVQDMLSELFIIDRDEAQSKLSLIKEPLQFLFKYSTLFQKVLTSEGLIKEAHLEGGLGRSQYLIEFRDIVCSIIMQA